MRYLSVCSGIEAVSMAWQPLGWQPAMFAEIDPFCCWLLRSRYRASRPVFMPSPHDAPDRKEAKRRAAAIRNIMTLPADGDVINAGDFTKIGKSDVGAIDLLAGGTPCQSFSVAGKRAGLDDPRGNLTVEFARLADRVRPLWLVWENVPGILSIDGGRTFGAFLGMLVECGYGLAYRILDAEHFGVPQSRRRVFVVGHLGNWRAAAAVLLDGSCLSGHPPPRRKTRQNAPTLPARSAAGGGLGTDFDLDGGLIVGTMKSNNGGGGSNSADHAAAGYIIPAGGTDGISRCLNAGGMGRQDYESETLLAHTLLGKENDSHDFEKQTYITHALSADGFDASEDGTGRGVPMVPVAFHLRGREGGAMPEVSDTASLRADTGGSSNSYIAFSAKDYGTDANHVAPTLRGMGYDRSHANGGGQAAIAFSTNQRSEVRERTVQGGLISSRGGGNQIDGVVQSRIGESPVPAAFTLHGSDGTASAASSTEVAGSIRTRAPGSIENSSTTAALQEQSVASPLIAASTGQVNSSDTNDDPPDLLHTSMAVRRLTPRECERLQGFPDDYTLVEYRGRPAADGPRYKALGNSMAVPVMRWIGERIAQVDAILREHGDRREP